MRLVDLKLASMLCVVSFFSGVLHLGPVRAQAVPGGIDVAQAPLFTSSTQPPLNMLVMGKDHKIYYEAYNDASDLDGDGALDIGYKPASIDYYGYFNSNVCYTWDAGKNHFAPSSLASNKQCSGQWSGDFLNYLTTSRMDALRRVLYGGWRQVDSSSETVLQGAFFPQDAHSWGKEYQSIERDGYDIAKYAPLAAPEMGRYHLFAVTTVTGNDRAYPNYQAPLFRVLKNTDKRVWNWLSMEGPVAGNKCFNSSNQRVDCVSSGGSRWELVPSEMLLELKVTTWKRANGSGSPSNRSAMDDLFTRNAVSRNLCGTGPVGQINRTSGNPFSGANGCTDDKFLTRIEGQLVIPVAGDYRFGIDGDDAVDLFINGVHRVGWYGGHSSDRSSGALDSHSAIVSLTAGTHSIEFRHQEDTGGEGWGLFLKQTHGATTRDDYFVRVLTCPADAALRDSSCKNYPGGQWKPTGILHDYGETARMYFGLITGTQYNNLQGGVLRRNVSDFGDEIDANTGQFKTDVNGIANTISRLRMIGGSYSGKGAGFNNLNDDANWNWNGGTGNCPSFGNRALNNGECRMWGNPLAEMLYESLRYFAGATSPTAAFATGGASQGKDEEGTMRLTTEPWKDPYAEKPNGGGFLSCAKPFQTIISDINPSYDGDVPGTAFGNISAPSGTPSSITSFNASAQGQAIWNAEFGGGAKSVFIGEVAGQATDGAPTAKTASSFGNIRGLAPEEPTKGGTYYSASVARFARNTDISSAPGQQNLSTYAIALASPLPKIEFPAGGGTITLLPFAKTASGTFGDGARKPTNTIVDFYVEQIVNLPNQPFNSTINGGRPYAVFRINYEDVEQGNDHDMDAIVRYMISAREDGDVEVTLISEYASGSADQNMGYVMSGTTADGVYLDVRDTDSNTDAFYELNTPYPLLPGACSAANPPAACFKRLPLTSTRIFTPRTTGSDAVLLENPLWYAAKYGAPDPAAVDADGDDVPDNYFLVTNPANLREQLDKAFTDIIAHSQPTASVATSTPRYVNGVTLAYEASYTSENWSGDLKAYRLRPDGTYTGSVATWSAADKIPAADVRKVFTSEPRPGAGYQGYEGVQLPEVSPASRLRIQGTLDDVKYPNSDLIAYLMGDRTKEQGAAGCTSDGECPFRKRGSPMGDILNSTPAVVGVTSFGYGSVLADVSPGAAAAYPDFVITKKAVYGESSQNPVIFVGANDGMLHAIQGTDGPDGGKELFAYMPNSILDTVGQLALPSYIHRYYVDGSPTVGDAYLGGWKTVLLGSVGAGGRGVYALDVTNPYLFAAGDVMWEFTSADDDRMGQFLGRPYMGLAAGGQWIAAFGNGYNSNSHTAVLFIRDLATGSEIKTLDTGVGCAAGSEGCDTGPNGLGPAVIVDNDGDGAGDTIYAGDYLGNLWRFEYVGGQWVIGNSGRQIFTARGPELEPQSITSGVYTVANPLGGTMVMFGTGRYLNADDADSTRAGVDSVYGIWDNRMWNDETKTWVEGATVAERQIIGYVDLERQWITEYSALGANNSGGYRAATRNPVDFRTPDFPEGKLGWYIDLDCAGCNLPGGEDPLVGERVTATPQGVMSDVVFNTFRPEGDSCEPGSVNATLVFDALTGAASYVPIPPLGGWPDGQEPPAGALIGTETGRGPPPGEPPIVIIAPTNPIVPPLCDPDDPDCNVPCDPATDPDCTVPVSACSWRSPNAAGRPPGKLIPCGRISWRQLR